MKNFKKLFSVVIAALSLGIAGGVHANPVGTPDVLVVGGSNFLNSTPVGLYEQLSFTGSFSVIASSTSAFSASPFFTGTLTSLVISGDTRNPLGGLDFVYQITNNTGGKSDGIHRMTVDNFGGVLTDVGFIRAKTIPPQKLPTSVDRSSIVDNGDVIGWNFLPNPTCGPAGCFGTPGVLQPGRTSAQLIVYTNATQHVTTTAQFIDGGIASAPTFAPIPEPETYGLVLAGLGLMGFVIRRRSRNNAA